MDVEDYGNSLSSRKLVDDSDDPLADWDDSNGSSKNSTVTDIEYSPLRSNEYGVPDKLSSLSSSSTSVSSENEECDDDFDGSQSSSDTYELNDSESDYSECDFGDVKFSNSEYLASDDGESDRPETSADSSSSFGSFELVHSSDIAELGAVCSEISRDRLKSSSSPPSIEADALTESSAYPTYKRHVNSSSSIGSFESVHFNDISELGAVCSEILRDRIKLSSPRTSAADSLAEYSTSPTHKLHAADSSSSFGSSFENVHVDDISELGAVCSEILRDNRLKLGSTAPSEAEANRLAENSPIPTHETHPSLTSSFCNSFESIHFSDISESVAVSRESSRARPILFSFALSMDELRMMKCSNLPVDEDCLLRSGWQSSDSIDCGQNGTMNNYVEESDVKSENYFSIDTEPTFEDELLIKNLVNEQLCKMHMDILHELKKTLEQLMNKNGKCGWEVSSEVVEEMQHILERNENYLRKFESAEVPNKNGTDSDHLTRNPDQISETTLSKAQSSAESPVSVMTETTTSSQINTPFIFRPRIEAYSLFPRDGRDSPNVASETVFPAVQEVLFHHPKSANKDKNRNDGNERATDEKEFSREDHIDIGDYDFVDNLESDYSISGDDTSSSTSSNSNSDEDDSDEEFNEAFRASFKKHTLQRIDEPAWAKGISQKHRQYWAETLALAAQTQVKSHRIASKDGLKIFGECVEWEVFNRKARSNAEYSNFLCDKYKALCEGEITKAERDFLKFLAYKCGKKSLSKKIP